MPQQSPSLPATCAAHEPASAVSAASARFWNRIVRQYAADPIADMAGYETTLQRVRGLLAPDQQVLEIGCGTGSTALLLAPHTQRLLATDLSVEMIAIARDKLAAQPLPQLSFAVADATGADWGAGCWDTVLAFNLLHLVGDLDQTLAQIVRALKPGGLLIAKTPCVRELNPLIPWLALPLMRLLGKAPPVLCFDAAQLQAALLRHCLQLEAAERHGTRGRDIRLFTVARKPLH